MPAAVVNWASIRCEGAPNDNRALASVRMKSFLILFAAKSEVNCLGRDGRVSRLTDMVLDGLDFSTRLRAPERDSCQIAEFPGKPACKRECSGAPSDKVFWRGRWKELFGDILSFAKVSSLRIRAHRVHR